MNDQVCEPVILNIYDMYWTNTYTTTLGLGVFHSGVEIYGTEYAYGGHQFAFSGVFEIGPKDAEDLGDNYRYKESVPLGYTSFTKEEVQTAVAHLGRDFKGNNYHLMNKNCNHFATELCQLLCGREIPPWVNRLAYMGTCLPFIEKILPKEWLTPTALEESVKQTNNSKESANGNYRHNSDSDSTSSRKGSRSSTQGLLKYNPS